MKHARGFTLLEMLVAAALFALAMSLLLGIFTRASRQLREGGDRAGAALLAESLLAAPELEAPLRPGRREGRSVDGRYHWVLEAHPYPQSPLPPGRGRMLLQLQLEVRWGQGGQLRWDSLRLVPEARGGGR